MRNTIVPLSVAHPMFATAQPVREISSSRTDFASHIRAEVASSVEPMIIRGLVADWPAVQAADSSADDLLAYLLRFDVGAVVPISAGPPQLQGRLFYNQNFTGLNVDRGRAHCADFLQRVHRDGIAKSPPLYYLASEDVDSCLPNFRGENDLDFGDLAPLVNIWIGTRTRVAAHNDMPMNIACVVAGARRFTLFPPDQTPNLYIGPFDLTPAGRPISLVDFAAPNLAEFPKFRTALAHAQIATLQAGDALVIPSMWWHHIEALGNFNILVNYWWRTAPSYLGTPQDVLTHAMMTIRDLPEEEKKIWRDLFDHYIFGADGAAVCAHIPPIAQGALAPMNEDRARGIRAFLLNRLNR